MCCRLAAPSAFDTADRPVRFGCWSAFSVLARLWIRLFFFSFFMISFFWGFWGIDLPTIRHSFYAARMAPLGLRTFCGPRAAGQKNFNPSFVGFFCAKLLAGATNTPVTPRWMVFSLQSLSHFFILYLSLSLSFLH